VGGPLGRPVGRVPARPRAVSRVVRPRCPPGEQFRHGLGCFGWSRPPPESVVVTTRGRAPVV
jgi:hypothetical protein